MCYAILEIKYKNESDKPLKRVDSKDQLSKELVQLERLGTVASVTVFTNHHTHILTETWIDVIYQEPQNDAPQGGVVKA